MCYSLVGNSSSSHCCATRPCKPCWISWLWYLIWLAVLGFISLVYESPQHPVRFRSPWKPPISNTKLGTGRRPPTKTYLIQQILGIANGRHSHLVWWRHQMDTFSALLVICAGNSPHKGQWRGALMFTLICARINGWVNNREAGDLRRYRAPYDVIVIE